MLPVDTDLASEGGPGIWNEENFVLSSISYIGVSFFRWFCRARRISWPEAASSSEELDSQASIRLICRFGGSWHCRWLTNQLLTCWTLKCAIAANSIFFWEVGYGFFMCFSSQILRITTDSGGNLNCLERFVQIPPEESSGKAMFRNC